MNKGKFVSKGVTTRSNFFDGTVQEQRDFHIDGQPTQDSVTASDQALGSHGRYIDAAAQCDIARTEEEEMLSLPEFTYPELMSQPGNIRLITLLPALYLWSPIRCSLFNTSIAEEDHLEYNALSYTWEKDVIYGSIIKYDDDKLRTPIQTFGVQAFSNDLKDDGNSDDGNSDDGELHAIILNGHILHIGENLMDALRRLRHKTEPQIWWVDAICIDQMDNSDRSFQVQYMRQVYEKAKQVVVWLGEEMDLTGTAIETFKWIGQHVNTARTSEDRQLRTPEILGCSQLLVHSWWERVWIIQEVSLSGNVNVQCGGYNFKWTLIENIAKVDDTNYEFWNDLADLDGWLQSRILVDYRNLIQNGNIPVLVSFLHSARNFHASDVRDKLYALLGISSQTLGVTPNYDLPAPEVFTKFAQEVILQTGTLDIFSEVHRKPCLAGEGGTSELPSWVPNWGPHEVRMINLVRVLVDSPTKPHIYMASGPRQAEAHF
jgi:hypothetical protein